MFCVIYISFFLCSSRDTHGLTSEAPYLICFVMSSVVWLMMGRHEVLWDTISICYTFLLRNAKTSHVCTYILCSATHLLLFSSFCCSTLHTVFSNLYTAEDTDEFLLIPTKLKPRIWSWLKPQIMDRIHS